jgi:hypothetical protein
MDSPVCADASQWTEVDIPIVVCPHFHFAPRRPRHIHLKLRVSAVRPEVRSLIDHSRCVLEFSRLENSSIPTNFFILYMITFPPFSYILLHCFPPILHYSVVSFSYFSHYHIDAFFIYFASFPSFPISSALDIFLVVPC